MPPKKTGDWGSSKKAAEGGPGGGSKGGGGAKGKGNSSGGKKAGGPSSSGPSNSSANSKPASNSLLHGIDDPNSREAREQKQQQTRQTIGGASWTGKLPLNLFHEHCQKAGWEKPEYTMKKYPEGFLPTIIVRCKNLKTNITEQVSFTPPSQLGNYQTTPVEARHYGATYALNRVSSMKNIHLTLPPSHQVYWKQFEVARKEDVKAGKAWMYEADPFHVQRDRAASEEKSKKEREAREEATKKATAGTGMIVLGGGSSGGGGGRAVPFDRNKAMKGWQNVPVAEMAKNMRKQVEQLIRKYHVWNPMGIEMNVRTKDYVVRELTVLGFRKSHVEEGCEWTKDKEECLGELRGGELKSAAFLLDIITEWLLVHVPEDDLPPRFLPDKYTVGLSITGANVVLSLEYAAKRLSESGYSLDLCREALATHDGSEALAAERLMYMLISQDQTAPPIEPNLVSFEEGEPWEEEQTSLEAIWGAQEDQGQKEGGTYKEPKFTRLSKTVSVVRLDLDPPPPKHMKGSFPEKLYVRIQKPVNNYPTSIPVITIYSNPTFSSSPNQPKLPAHVRLSIIRQVASYAIENLAGEQMVFTIVDWLEREVVRIVEYPGRLRDVASAVTVMERDLSVQPTKTTSHRTGKSSSLPRPITWRPGSSISMKMYMMQKTKLTFPPLQRMLSSRSKLPAWSKRNEIVKAVNECQVTIITGETGSGKSTQAVQFILDDLIEKKLGEPVNIVCTQPRRISALGLADRVAEERYGEVGEEVGYIIRGDSKVKKGVTKITFVTTGVLLRKIQMAGVNGGGEKGFGDFAGLEGISHVFVDEVHERSLDTDFLLVLLKNALSVRKDLKVILMSATVDRDAFATYFQEALASSGGKVGQVEIEGRTFPVEDIYLDSIIRKTDFELFFQGQAHDTRNPQKGTSDTEEMDPYIGATIRSLGDRINYALIAQTVSHIDEELGQQGGGILIFLPGTMEITRCLEAISHLPNSQKRFHALPLHASLLPSEQRLVFPPPPHSKRKVIAATNVAETSITIEDIVAVIDTGRVKETSYDVINDMARLTETWASLAACKQRRGRAGRVRPGKCYKLFTQKLEKNKMPDRPEPELKRVPLQQTCLGVKAMGIKDVRGFLAKALTPPDTLAVEGSLLMLEKIGALKDDELTALGRHLAMIPADLKCSKLLVYGSIFGCLDRALTIAAILSTKSPFVSPLEKRDESRSCRTKFSQNHGDLLADTLAFEDWSALRADPTSTHRILKQWCEQNFLSHHTCLDISSTKSQFLASLKEISFLPFSYRLDDNSPTDAALNLSNTNIPLIKALVAAAFTPQITRIQFPEKKFLAASSGAIELDPEAREIKYFTASTPGRVFIHPGSTLFSSQTYPNRTIALAYWGKLATGRVEDQAVQQTQQQGKIFISNLTPLPAYPLLLFGGGLQVDTLGRGMTIDGWLRIKGWGRIGVLVSMLRGMLDGLLMERIDEPGKGWGVEVGQGSGEEVIRIVKRLIEMDGMDE